MITPEEKLKARRAIELRLYGDIYGDDWEPTNREEAIIDLMAEIVAYTGLQLHDPSDTAQDDAVEKGIPTSITKKNAEDAKKDKGVVEK